MTLNICKSFRTLCVMLIPAVLAVVSLMSCTKEDKSMTLPNENVVAEWPMGVAYEIFVQSYADHNGDGIGDINGLTQKLNYLKDLGVSAIWLMPIMPSPSYHKYDVTDYYGIHADYGNIDAFKNFVNEAHKRDIKVIIDLIVNHTSNERQWFEQSANNPGSALREHYIWANDSRIKEISSLEKAATGDSDNITQWHEHPENDKKYYGFSVA
jgi:alpha-amylase